MKIIKKLVKIITNNIADLSVREKIIIAIAGCSVIFFIYWQFLYLPLLERRENVENHLSSTDQTIKNLQEEKQELSEIQASTEIMEQLETTLPGHEEFEVTFNDLMNIFYRNELDVQAVQVTEADKTDRIDTISLDGRIEGNYRSVFNTLQEVEAYDRLVNVTGIELRSLDGFEEVALAEGDSETYQQTQRTIVNISLEFYYDDISIKSEENKLRQEFSSERWSPFLREFDLLDEDN